MTVDSTVIPQSSLQTVGRYFKTGLDCTFLIFPCLTLRKCIRRIISKGTDSEVQQSRYIDVSLILEMTKGYCVSRYGKNGTSRNEISKAMV
jgi:hypothetical protein